MSLASLISVFDTLSVKNENILYLESDRENDWA